MDSPVSVTLAHLCRGNIDAVGVIDVPKTMHAASSQRDIVVEWRRSDEEGSLPSIPNRGEIRIFE
jgi:hypothetical protein